MFFEQLPSSVYVGLGPTLHFCSPGMCFCGDGCCLLVLCWCSLFYFLSLSRWVLFLSLCFAAFQLPSYCAHMIPLEGIPNEASHSQGDCIPCGNLTLDMNMGVRLIPAADPAFVAGTPGANLLVIQVHTARGNLATLREPKATRCDSSLLHSWQRKHAQNS